MLMALLVICPAFADDSSQKLAVKKGKVEAFSEKIPVPAGVKEVTLGAENLYFSVDVKSEKQMYATVKKFESFYRGKKLFGKKAPAFKKQPDMGSASVSWQSLGCKPGEAGPQIGISGDRRELSVSVQIAPKCDAPLAE